MLFFSGSTEDVAYEDAVGGHVHRSQLDVRFHEVAFGGARQFDDRGEFLGVRGHQPCTQGQQIGVHP